MDDYKPTAFLKGPNKSFVNVIKYSSNGRYLGVGTKDGCVGIVETSTYTWKQDFNCAEHHAILDIDFSTNSNVLAAATNSVIKLCNCTNGEISRTINVSHNSLFTHLSFGRNKNLAAATENFLIYIFDDYDIIHKQTYKVFNLHLTPITSLNFIDHSFIISSDRSGHCIKWNSTDYSIQQEKFPVKKYTSMIRIFNTSVSPDHKYVLLTYFNSEITSWEILDSAERIRRNLHSSIVFFKTYTGHNSGSDLLETTIKAHFWFTPEWKLVISGSEKPCVYIWNFETALIVKRIQWYAEPQSSSYAIPNPANILEFTTLQRNGVICVWKKIE